MNFYFYLSKIATPLLIPSNILIFLLIFFYYMSFVRNKIFFRKFFTFIFIIFSVISILPIGHNLIYFFLEKDFYNLKILKKYDYIFVPSGSTNRVIEAIKIKNNFGFEDTKIIFSSGFVYLDKRYSKSEEPNTMNDLLLNSKINSEDIIFLPEARNTYENFKRLNEFLTKEKKKSEILLITDAFHMNRSLLIAKEYNINISGFPAHFYTKSKSIGLINSYQNINIIMNLKKFDIFFKELISTAVFKIFFSKNSK